MQDKDKMHPDDMRNLIIFGILSVILWLSYDHFILKPKVEAMKAAQEISVQKAVELQTQEGMVVETERPREEVLTETASARVTVDTDLVFGSFNLTGARLDDLSLKQYHKTVERIENVSILSPSGSLSPKYIEHGWVPLDKSIKVPNKDSVWSLIGGSQLSANEAIKIQWKNDQGLTFEQEITLNDDYGFNVKQTVMNEGSSDITLYPYALIMRRGIPEDFLGRWIVHEGPIGYFDDELIEKTYNKMDKESRIVKTANQGWIGLTSKDWFTALVPAQQTESKFRMTYTKGAAQGVKDRYQTDYTGAAQLVKTGETTSYETNFFAGAKKLSLLTKYEDQWNVPHFDLAVDFGLFYFLTRPFFAIINFFYGFVGNFGVAIILFTVVLRICVFPLANTSFKSFAKMRQIGPQMSEMREKYKDDKQQMQKELVKLYQKEKVNPMAGCLPILVQIPIFFSLFKVLSNTIEMRHAPFFGWIQDLSAPDPTSVFNLFGLLPFTPFGFLMIGAWPCLMLLTMIVQRKLSPPPTDKMQAKIIAAMPWFMTFILAQFAAGLVIYWTFNNLFSVIQQYIIMRRMGVEVDLIGNILGKNKEPKSVEGVNAEAALVEEKIEDALSKDEAEKPAKPISKPKPKKKNPTKKKKK